MDLDGIRGDTDSGVPQHAVLVAFADALVAADRAEPGAAAHLDAARTALAAALGPAAVADAAGVAGNFQRMVRIADGCGIGLGGMADFSASVREELRLEEFAALHDNPG